MTDVVPPDPDRNSAEADLREELARADIARESVPAILVHLLANGRNSLLNDEIIARVRGMVRHVTEQVSAVSAEPTDTNATPQAEELDRLFANLIQFSPLLEFCHATTLEGRLLKQLESSNAIDPVLSPLLQSCVASEEGDLAELAIAVLASQARFMQHYGRMELPLSELPDDVYDGMVSHAGDWVRSDVDVRGGKCRLIMLAQLIDARNDHGKSGLSVAHAGASLFCSALAKMSGQSRTSAVLATDPEQTARLAIMLRASGLDAPAIGEQFGYLHGDLPTLESVETMRADRARKLLADFA